MPILQQREQKAIEERFQTGLKSDVSMTLYTKPNLGGLFIPGRECQSCQPTQQLLEEVCVLSPKLSLNVVDYYSNESDAAELGVDKIPALITHNGSGDNVRFYGLPSGMEFAVLLDSIIETSNKNHTLELETRRALKNLKEDVHIQVFVTPN